MNVEPRPCSRQTIEDFLADRLSDADLQAFEEHLDHCTACRESLDGLAAERSWWEDFRGYLSPPCDATSEHGNNLGEESSLALSALRNYLAPTDDPRMLGRLGGYEVAGIVGCGGMGMVLKAFDPPLNRYVAIKVLGPQFALNSAARQRFAREAKAAATVVHSNVIAIHAVAETHGMPYFVMPYVRGPSLEKRLQQTGALPVVEVVRIGMQIAAGLAAAHAQGLVHRDIKPANILLEEGVERVTLTDFGLARLTDDASLTRSGVIAGTPQYMSPEQARGHAVDHRSDLFSLGSVLYALCTGRPPFRSDTVLGVMRLVDQTEPRPIREINPDIPEWLAAVVERLQAKDPADRFQSAAEVADLLERFLAHLQQPTSIPAPALPFEALEVEANQESGPGTARRSVLILLGCAMLLTAAVVVFGGFVPDARDKLPEDAAPTSPASRLPTSLVILGLVALTILGAWFIVRHKRRRVARITKGPQPSPPNSPGQALAIRCVVCGKKLRAKAELAGKKVQCPACGGRMVVPQALAGKSRPQSARSGRKVALAGTAAVLALGALAATFVWFSGTGEQAPARSLLDVTLGAELQPDVPESGFSYQESHNNEPFRWTDGKAQLTIPIRKGETPRGLLVKLRTFRPPGVNNADLRIRINNRELFEGKINLGNWEQTIDLEGVELKDKVTLDLVSDTFAPLGNRRDDGKASDDPRSLGVQVWAVKLLSSRPLPAPLLAGQIRGPKVLPVRQPSNLLDDFRGGRFNGEHLRFAGPTPEKFLTPEPEGLRLRYTGAGAPSLSDPSCIFWRYHAAGDFVVAARYELLKCGRPAAGASSPGVELYVRFVGPRHKGIALTRGFDADGNHQFLVSVRSDDDQGKEITKVIKTYATTEKSLQGRLRLVRNAGTIRASFAEGDEASFTEFYRSEVSDANVCLFRFGGTSGDDPKAVLDLRMLDYQLRGVNLALDGRFGKTPAQAIDAEMARAEAMLLVQQQQLLEAGKGPLAANQVAFDFRDKIETYPALSLQGPNARSVAKTDAQGLRISIPEGQRDTRPVMVKLEHRLRGDFDIALGYELIGVGEPIGQWGAGILIRAWFDTPSPLSAIVSLFMQRGGELAFGSHKIVQGPDGKEQYLNNTRTITAKRRGKLRLVRTGPHLHYLVAEDGSPFINIQAVAIGTADVRLLEVSCSTMYTPISLDARLTKLVVAAAQFPDGIPSERAPAPADDPGVPEGLLFALLLALLTLLCLGLVATWLVARHRKGSGLVVASVAAPDLQPRKETRVWEQRRPMPPLRPGEEKPA